MTSQNGPQSAGGAPEPPLSIDAKTWARRADGLQFTQLEIARATAEKWRTGLAALTSLLSVTSIAVAPGVADHLDGWWRISTAVLAVGGLIVLLYATWQAMDAAFGVPDEAQRMSGERLRQWENKVTTKAVAALKRARVATLVGLALLISTAALVIFGTAPKPQTALIRVNSPTGSFCGHLSQSDSGIGVIGNDGSIHQTPIDKVTSVQPAASC